MLGVYLHVLCVFMGVCMHTHRRCRHHWVSTSAWVCVSQRVSVSVWVVSTRNNTLPWDLLNGHHLSLSGKALGKLMRRLRCFLPAASPENEPASLLWKEKKRKTAMQIWMREKKNSYSEAGKVDGEEREWHLTAFPGMENLIQCYIYRVGRCSLWDTKHFSHGYELSYCPSANKFWT